MVLSSVTELLPLEIDTNGVVRVGKTRVTLDTVIAAFSDSATLGCIGSGMRRILRYRGR